MPAKPPGGRACAAKALSRGLATVLQHPVWRNSQPGFPGFGRGERCRKALLAPITAVATALSACSIATPIRYAAEIDIGTHASFSDDRLVHIVVETWPDDQLFFELKGIRGSRNAPYSRDERSQLRKAGLASFVQIGDRVFAPPGGLSTAGTSTQVTRQANLILWTIRNFEEQARDDPSNVIAHLKQRGGQPSETLEFVFAVFDDGYGVIETTSGLPIRLSA